MSEELHTLVGLYVVDALDDDERARFEAHLADCSGLPAGGGRVPVHDRPAEPAHGRAAARVPARGDHGARRQHPAGVGARHRTSWRPAAAPRCGSWRRPWPWPPRSIALLLGIGWISSHRALDRQEAISAVLTAPDAKSVDLGGEGTMRVVYSPTLDRSVVVADGLADLPSDSTYALWFIGPGGPEEAALFRTSGGRATKVLPRTPEGYQALGVTKEPAGGSATPTQPILLQGDVTAA